MTYIHRMLLKRGKLDDLLPDQIDLEIDKAELETAKAEIHDRISEEAEIRREVRVAIRRLNELDKRNHYGESLRRAFGGR